MKRFKSFQKAKAYLEPKRVSTMELFVNILNGLLFTNCLSMPGILRGWRLIG